MLEEMLKANDDPWGAEANSIATAVNRRTQDTEQERKPDTEDRR